jgi:cytochrome c oxidase assembly protein subunit 15
MSLKLNRFAIVTAIFTILLITAGATVTSTGSGDAVPDWPLSYGTLFPRMVGGILYEHSHRIIAGITAILITILAIWTLKSKHPVWVKILGVVAFVSVLVQATLGGLRVLVISNPKLQDMVLKIFSASHIEPIRIGIAITHAGLAEIILCITFTIALASSRIWKELENYSTAAGDKCVLIARLFTLTTIFVFVQILLGALVRHTQSGLAIPDFPLSFGRIIPPFDNLPYDPNAPFPVSYETVQFKVAVHFAHRVWAFVVAGIGIYVSILAIKNSKVSPVSIAGKILICLIILQILLGALVIWTGLSVIVTIIHVAIGASILGTSLILSLMSWKIARESRPVWVGETEFVVK